MAMPVVSKTLLYLPKQQSVLCTISNSTKLPQADGSVKPAAADFIDQCQLKIRNGLGSVHRQQALVLINWSNTQKAKMWCNWHTM